MSSSKPLRVAACVIERNGEFLITKRFKHSHLGHLWEFPGGKIEIGESVEQCAIRECREEIGVEIEVLAPIEEMLHHYEDLSVHLTFLLCALKSGEPQALECAEYRWVRAEDLDQFEFPAADRQLLKKLKKQRITALGSEV